MQATADGFPHRPIRLIVYTSPGGLIDTTAREFARIARKHHTDQPIVVINKPGAGGIVAFEDALQMPADGHTLLAVTRSNISKLVATGREDLIDRLDWHSYLMDNAHVVITNVAEGMTSWEDLVASAEERGNSIWVGVDIGGVKHISGVKAGLQSDMNVRWIPFPSGGRAVATLLGGLGHAYLGNPRDAVGRSDLRIVAVCAPERLADFPDAPTFRELGIEGLENERIWRGLAMRQGVPDEVRSWYDELVRRVVNDPEWAAIWEGEGLNLEYKGSEAFTRMVQEDREEFRYHLERMGLLRETGSEAGVWASLLTVRGLWIMASGFAAALWLSVFVFGRTRWRECRGEAAAAGLFLALAAFAFVLTRQLPPASSVDPVGAAGVPLLWISLIALLSLYQLWRLRGGLAAAMSAVPPISRLGVLFMGGLGGYAVALPWVGYFTATLVFLPVVLIFLGLRRSPPIIAITVGWAVFVLVVFQQVLMVDLPQGRLFTQSGGDD